MKMQNTSIIKISLVLFLMRACVCFNPKSSCPETYPNVIKDSSILTGDWCCNNIIDHNGNCKGTAIPCPADTSCTDWVVPTTNPGFQWVVLIFAFYVSYATLTQMDKKEILDEPIQEKNELEERYKYKFKHFVNSPALSGLSPVIAGSPAIFGSPAIAGSPVVFGTERKIFEFNQSNVKTKTASVHGYPLAAGQKIKGVEKSSGLFREKGYYKNSDEIPEYNIVDTGDMNFDDVEHKFRENEPAKDCYFVGKCSEKIAAKVYKEMKTNDFVLNIGGDHSIAFGTLAGVLRANPNTNVVWVDAHADLNPPKYSPSGNMHGMPVAAHLNVEEFNKFPGWEWFSPILKQKNIYFIGLRDLDPFEKSYLSTIRNQVYTRDDVITKGIYNIMEEIKKNIGNNNPIHLSFDIDGVDPKDAPATGTTSVGGLTARESLYIAKSLAETGNLHSMDLVEINPEIIEGAPAGQSDMVFTKSKFQKFNTNTNTNTNNNLKEEYNTFINEKSSNKTLHLGWEIVKCAMGYKIL